MSNIQSFYKWVILLACFIIMAVPFSIINAIHPLFITPVTEALGIKISSFSLIFTIGAITISLFSPIIGKLLIHIDVRIIMAIGALLVGLGFIGYSFSSKVYHFYIIAAIIAVGLSALTVIPISTLINSWFLEKKGTAMGIAFAGAGTGTFVWMQIVSRILKNQGYHFAYLLLGIIILAVSLPISIFVVKKPDIYADISTVKENISQKDSSYNNKSLLKDKTFILFSVGLALMGIVIAGTQIHVQPYLITIGYELNFNANIGSLLALSALLGNILGGFIFDRFSTKYVLYFFGTLSLISYVCLFFSTTKIFAYLFAVCFGLCLCLPSLWPSYGIGKLFSKQNYSVTLGIANMFFVLGGALGPFLSGLIADYSWGYQTAWILYFILTCVYLYLFIYGIKIKSILSKK